MQYIVCKINQCPFRSSSGFCLHRCVVINENGQCDRLVRGECGGQVESKFKCNSDEWLQKREMKLIEDKEEEEENGGE